MDAEILVWTLIFFGGTVVIVAFLFYWSWKKDREKAAIAEAHEADEADG